MHELQVTQSILETVLAYACQNEVEKIFRIHLIIGVLNDFQREWIQRYFDYLSKGSPAEGAQIAVERVEPGFRCNTCGRRFEVNLRSMDRVRCPDCGEENVRLERGTEFFIRDMEVV